MKRVTHLSALVFLLIFMSLSLASCDNTVPELSTCKDGKCVDENEKPACESDADCKNHSEGKTSCNPQTHKCVFPYNKEENSKQACGDGQDNDNDGDVDCEDQDCKAFCKNCEDGQTWVEDDQVCACKIENAKDFIEINAKLDSLGTSSGISCLKKDRVPYFYQTNEITIDFEQWESIGTLKKPFTGIYNGNNKQIILSEKKSIKLTENENIQIGIFGNIKDATLKNIKLNFSDFTYLLNDNLPQTSSYYGTFVVQANNSTLSNIELNGDITIDTTPPDGGIGGTTTCSTNCSFSIVAHKLESTTIDSMQVDMSFKVGENFIGKKSRISLFNTLRSETTQTTIVNSNFNLNYNIPDFPTGISLFTLANNISSAQMLNSSFYSEINGKNPSQSTAINSAEDLILENVVFNSPLNFIFKRASSTTMNHSFYGPNTTTCNFCDKDSLTITKSDPYTFLNNEKIIKDNSTPVVDLVNQYAKDDSHDKKWKSWTVTKDNKRNVIINFSESNTKK